MNLDELEIGKDAVVASVDCDEASLRQHILDMGLTPGVEVTTLSIQCIPYIRYMYTVPPSWYITSVRAVRPRLAWQALSASPT